MKKNIIVTDFSGVYRKEQFPAAVTVDMTDISGTNCYCDGEAFEEISGRLGEFPMEGIHFLDSGNYHYMSRVWLEKAEKPLTLLVFDNHTDMQMPAFGGLLSCGGWIAAALSEIPELRSVVLIGPDEEAFSQVEPEFRERVRFLSRERLREAGEKERAAFIREALGSAEKSLYLSVDKDVLRHGEADTGWSQGDMTLPELLFLLKTVFSCAKETGKELLTVDICGESEGGENREENIRANKALLECVSSLL